MFLNSIQSNNLGDVQRFTVLILLIASLSTACADKAKQAPDSGAGPESEAASVKILSPGEGETVTQPSQVRFEVSGVKLGTGADHHVHIYLDDDYVVQYSADPYTFQGLSPGKHRIKVAAAKPNHDEVASDEISVTVGGAGGAGSPADGSGYGY